MNGQRTLGFRFIGILSLVLVCSFVSPLQAQTALDYFDKKTSYDVYFEGTDDALSVVSDVEILRFETIGNKTFLVVQPSHFSLTDAEGFIDFEHVRAILPFRRLKVDKKSSTKIHYR